MTLLADQASAAQTAVEQLNSALLSARLNVATTWQFWGDTSKDNTLKALDMLGVEITNLKTVILKRVIDGERTFEWWVEQAGTLWESIRYYEDDIGNWSFFGILKQAATQTAVDVKTGVEKAAPKVESTLQWAVVGLVAFAIIYVVGFAKSLKA